MLILSPTQWITLITITVVNGFILSVFAMFRGITQTDAWRLLVPMLGLAAFLVSLSLFWTHGLPFYLSLFLGTAIGIGMVVGTPRRSISERDGLDSIRRLQLEMVGEKLRIVNGLLVATLASWLPRLKKASSDQGK